MDTIILAESGTSIVAAKKTAQKKYKCPYCELRVERSKLHIHIQDEHEDMIPDGYTALRVAFNTINHKTEGHCIICKGITDWNEDKGRYERLCNKPACHEAYKKLVAERTRKIYGTDRLQTDPKYADYVQKKALEGRKMSGKYKFTDGGEVSFMGTYERKFLEFMDQVMHCESEDILAPGPSIKYQFQGQTHIYISDFYYVPYNLIIEIKDGGRNRNTHPKRLGEEEEKIKAKEKAVADLKMFNYVRVTDNDFSQLMTIMALLKYQLSHPAMFKDDYIIRVNEASISENMSGTIAAALPPNGSNVNLIPNPIPHESDPDNYYLVQHPKKDKVSYSITKDPLQYSMISVDPEEKGFYKVYKTDKGKFDKKYVTFKIKDKQSAKELYNELAKVAESTQEIHDSSFKSSDYIYEALTGGGIILDPSQIMCDNRFELVDNLDEKEKKSMAKLYAWLKGTKLDKLEEQVEQLNPIPSDEDIDYNVLPDGPMSLEQLKIWKDAFDTMTPDQRIISNDLSTKKYGADCVSRYNSKYAYAMENIPPEVGVKEADETTPIDSSMSEYQAKLDKVKSVESEGSILIMVLTDRTYSYELYDSRDIEDLKDKWNRYLALPEEQRVLSSQTAGTIFGVDNESLFNRTINSYMSKQATDMEDVSPTDEGYLPYYIPSMKVMNSNPGGIFTNEGYIDAYKYTKLIQEFQYELKHAKTEADREAIKSKIIDYGWNPEIACLESALKRVKVMYENLNEIQEIDVKSFLEAQDATSQIPDGLTSEYLKDKIVPIFVVLVSGQKLHSKGIKWFTDSEWSHASLSLESSLDEMYTFTTGIDNAPNKRHKTGFAIDTKERYLREDPHMKVKVYALFITPEQKANIKEAIKWYIDHQDETAYSFKSILNIFFRKPTKRKMKSGDKCKMICSQFVYSILSLVNFRMRKSKDGSTISPADIDELSNDTRFYTVYQGGIDKYDQIKVDDLCYRLLPTLPMDIYGITESADISRKLVNNKFNKILGIANQLLND